MTTMWLFVVLMPIVTLGLLSGMAWIELHVVDAAEDARLAALPGYERPATLTLP